MRDEDMDELERIAEQCAAKPNRVGFQNRRGYNPNSVKGFKRLLAHDLRRSIHRVHVHTKKKPVTLPGMVSVKS